MTTASGSRDLPFTRQHIWRALARLPEYCEVCDVSYIRRDPSESRVGVGSRFVCVGGRHPTGEPPVGAVEGEIIEWAPEEFFGTRLQTAAGTWHVRTELADVGTGTTRVTISVRHDTHRGGRLRRGPRQRKLRALVQSTLDSELAKLPDHLRAAEPRHDSAVEVVQQAEGQVLHLRGDVDAQVVRRLELERRLTAGTVDAVDVSRLSYIDATALPPLVRWARKASQEGRRAIVRGQSTAFDETVGVVGVRSAFTRDA